MQTSAYSGYWSVPSWLTDRQTGRRVLIGYTISSARSARNGSLAIFSERTKMIR